MYIIAIQIAILTAHSVLFQFSVVNTKVCSLHFLPVDFVSKGYRKRKQLIDNAVPSVFDWAVDVTPKRKPPSVRPFAPKKRYHVVRSNIYMKMIIINKVQISYYQQVIYYTYN